MTLRTTIRISTVAAALVTVLAIAPAASAASTGHGWVLRRSAPTTADPHGTQARYDAQRVTLPASSTQAVEPAAVPDRVDGIGTARGPQVVQVSAAPTGNDSLSWAEAAIGGAFLLGASLLAAFAFMTMRARRQAGLVLPS
jgi:hypothetical protein